MVVPTNAPLKPVVPEDNFARTLFFHVSPPEKAFRGLIEAGAYDIRVAGPSVFPHVHDDRRLELCFLEKGRQEQLVDQRIVQLEAGEVLVIGPKRRHGMRTLAQEPCRMLFLVLRLPHPRSPFLCMDASNAAPLIQTLLRLSGRLMILSPIGRLLLRAIFDDLRTWQRCRQDADCRRFAAASVRIRTAALLAELAHAGGQQTTRASEWRVCVTDFIEKQLGEALRLKEIAAHMGLSPSHFKVRFRQETGLSPGDFIRRRRIEAAKQRLRGTGVSIATVAFDLGFPSSQHFAAVFRHYVGMTPREYRQRSRAAANPGVPRRLVPRSSGASGASSKDGNFLAKPGLPRRSAPAKAGNSR